MIGALQIVINTTEPDDPDASYSETSNENTELTDEITPLDEYDQYGVVYPARGGINNQN